MLASSFGRSLGCLCVFAPVHFMKDVVNKKITDELSVKATRNFVLLAQLIMLVSTLIWIGCVYSRLKEKIYQRYQ